MALEGTQKGYLGRRSTWESFSTAKAPPPLFAPSLRTPARDAPPPALTCMTCAREPERAPRRHPTPPFPAPAGETIPPLPRAPTVATDTCVPPPPTASPFKYLSDARLSSALQSNRAPCVGHTYTLRVQGSSRDRSSTQEISDLFCTPDSRAAPAATTTTSGRLATSGCWCNVRTDTVHILRRRGGGCGGRCCGRLRAEPVPG